MSRDNPPPTNQKTVVPECTDSFFFMFQILRYKKSTTQLPSQNIFVQGYNGLLPFKCYPVKTPPSNLPLKRLLSENALIGTNAVLFLRPLHDFSALCFFTHATQHVLTPHRGHLYLADTSLQTSQL